MRWLRPGGLIVAVMVAAACSSQPAASAGIGASPPSLAGHAMTACTISGVVPVEASVEGYCGTLQEHVVGHLGCGPSVIAAFVDAGTAANLDTSCVTSGSGPMPTFNLP